MESVRRIIGSLAVGNIADDIELEKLQLGQLMSRITNVLSLQCVVDELVTQVSAVTVQDVINYLYRSTRRAQTSTRAAHMYII